MAVYLSKMASTMVGTNIEQRRAIFTKKNYFLSRVDGFHFLKLK